MALEEPSWPVVLVTGANSGVGLGICKRLLVQIGSRQPLDALPQPFVTRLPPRDSNPIHGANSDLSIPCFDGLTLIMACRNEQRAEKARAELHSFLDEHVRKLRRMKTEGKEKGRERSGNGAMDVEHAELVKKNLKIEIEQVDLANLTTVFRCVERMHKKYPYISHLVLNAGGGSFDGINWLLCAKQMLTEYKTALTMPNYLRQNEGELSFDGLGWVFQTNVFGHFVLVRMLEPQLLASAHQANSTLGPRVIWLSSMEALPDFFDINDWQLRRTARSYETVKYEVDLIATYLDQQALLRAARARERAGSGQPGARAEPVIRHFIAQPGVCSTGVAVDLAGPLLAMLKDILLYIARWFGSPHHPIDPYKGALSTTHLILVPLSFVTFFVASSTSKPNSHPNSSTTGLTTSGHYLRSPCRFGTETDFWGTEHVGLTPVREWELEKRQRDAEALVEKCDELLIEIINRESEPIEIETASGRM